MKSELLQILELVRCIQTRPTSARDLCAFADCSLSTLSRRLAEAARLGAHVESIKVGKRWVYHLGNAAQVGPRLDRWIELERARSLV